MKTIADILNTLDAFEYSSDGFVKRYPDEKDYEQSIDLLKKIFNHPKETSDVVIMTRQEHDALMEKINGW